MTPDPTSNPTPKTAQETYWARQHPRTETDGQPLIVPDYYGDNSPAAPAFLFRIVKVGWGETDGPTWHTGDELGCTTRLHEVAVAYMAAGWSVWYTPLEHHSDALYPILEVFLTNKHGEKAAGVTFLIRPI